MVRLPRTFPRIALACSLAAPVVFVAPLTAHAQADQQQTDQNQALRQAVEDFWHYGKIARYDLAAAAGEQVLSYQDQPVAVLEAFEAVASQRNDSIDQWLLRWQGIDTMREVTGDINRVINAGYRERGADPTFIQQQIERMPQSERAYRLAMQRLRESGELAVPMMIDYLRSPDKAEYHRVLRRALRDMGRPALNPLLATTEMENADTLVSIVTILGDMGYDVAVPYLARLAQGQDTPSGVKQAATAALTQLGVSADTSAAQLYYDLAERFYYDNAAIRADTRDPERMASVWYWDQQRGLQRVQVPPSIFNEIMSMRASEYALKLGGGPEAQSLWLAANYKREAELPAGDVDRTRQQDQPSAHFYGVTSGPAYLDSALARALRDRNGAVALAVVKSLQDIVGQANLFDGQALQSLVDATASTDRLVRFESAFALASALPQQSFEGADRVVPLLGEAIGQTGQPSVLVVAPADEQTNRLIEGLELSGYSAVGANTAEGALAATTQLPSIDVVLVYETLGEENVEALLAGANQSLALSGVPRLVVVGTEASRFAQRAVSDRQLYVTKATDVESIGEELDRIRSESSLLPIDAQTATQVAQRAASLLATLAISGNTVYNVGNAEQRVLAALSDERPEIVVNAGQVLGLLRSDRAQSALLTAAEDPNMAKDVRISLFDNLAINAKLQGNRLSQDQVQSLQDVVVGETDPDIRSAAAEAYGALNLPPEQAKDLILEQSRVTTKPPTSGQ